MASQEPTFNAVLSHVTNFLTIAIHTILSERDVYPPDSFLTARAYNYPVRQSRHPGVCAWITSAVSTVQTEILKGAVACVAVVLSHPDSLKVLERFVFDLSKLPVVSKSDVNTPIVRSSDKDHGNIVHEPQVEDQHGPGGPRQHELADLTEQLRATLAALSTCSKRLRPIPVGCTFTVAIELREEADPPIGHPQPWVPVQPDLQTLRPRDGDPSRLESGSVARSSQSEQQARLGRERGGTRSVPVRAVRSGEVIFETWVEEGSAKAELTKQDLQGSGRTSSGEPEN